MRRSDAVRRICRPALAAAAWWVAAAPVRAQTRPITASRMAAHIAALAHDSMKGRPTPGPELELAGRYVEAEFRRYGLEPAGRSGSYIQRYALPGGATAPNVVAALRGADRAVSGQYVAVVAHMDHVGTRPGPSGDSIMNGADDNASGTAGVLAMAEAFARSPRPRRSLLFLVVSGEERGLLGSRHFVANPTVPLDSIVALINLDMISRNRPDSVYLNGWGKSSVSDLVRRLAASHPELGLSVGPDLEDRPLTPADSDHWPFQRAGIPYVFFYTGQHADYHGPGDHAERTDADKAARVAMLAALTARAVADAAGRPEWDPDSRRLNVGAAR